MCGIDVENDGRYLLPQEFEKTNMRPAEISLKENNTAGSFKRIFQLISRYSLLAIF